MRTPPRRRAPRKPANARGRRRRNPSGAGAREQILSAAQRLFAAYGFDATTTKKIAEQARVPTGLVFYYFSTKNDLLDALIRERSALDFVKSTVQAQLGAPGEPASHEALTAFGVQFLAALREREEIVRILFRELHEHGHAADQYRTLREQAAKAVTALLDRLVKPDRRRTFSTETAARMFIADLIMASTIDRERIDEPSFVADAVRVLLDGRT